MSKVYKLDPFNIKDYTLSASYNITFPTTSTTTTTFSSALNYWYDYCTHTEPNLKFAVDAHMSGRPCWYCDTSRYTTVTTPSYTASSGSWTSGSTYTTNQGEIWHITTT